jgi:hypothetical protein
LIGVKIITVSKLLMISLPGFNPKICDKKEGHMWKSSKPEDVRFIILGEEYPESDFSILKDLYSSALGSDEGQFPHVERVKL